MRKLIFSKSISTLLLSLLQTGFLLAQEGLLKGRVHTGTEDLPAATVSLNKKSLLTNSKGEFYFSVKDGTYILIITHTGYQKIEKEVKIQAGNTQVLDFIMMPGELMDEVVVLGSRSYIRRNNLNTAVPVDVFSAKLLEQTGQVSLAQMLNFTVPSLNGSRPMVNEPVTLRGLNPDQVLILVNGTRRHNSASITPAGVRGVLGNGSVPNDLNAIPFSAVEKIEILRDGAAAQYGSDAIAGVINIQLKKSTGKTTAQLQTGQYYKGDGENIMAGINHGVVLNKKGFLNFSANFRRNNPTYRGGEYKGTVYKNIPANATPAAREKLKAEDDSIVKARNFNRNKVSNAGSPGTTLAGIAINGGYPFKKKTEIFWTAIANTRKTPFINSYVFPKTTTRINPELFPDGYGERPYHNTHDLSGIAGIKGETKSGVHWKFTSTYGNNTDRWYIENTNNPSQYYTLGKDAPTSFYGGTLIYGQFTNNVEVSKSFLRNTGESLNLSFGTEWRLENFQMKEGEEATWRNYDEQRRKQGGTAGTVVPPENVVNKNRNVGGAYVDLELELFNRLLVNLAGRYEYYSDFGGNPAGKLAIIYKVFDKFSIRGSVNNGFRAPSLQQRFYSSTNRTGLTPAGMPNISGIFRNDSPVAQGFGVPSLQAERSVNVSGGVTATLLKHIRLTVDAYWIQIKDRIVLGGQFDSTNALVRQILSSFPDVNSAQFFSNAINTRTRGADVILNGTWKIKNGNVSAMLAGNVTQTRLFGKIKTADKLPADSINTNTLFNRYNRGRLELGQPNSKIILSLNYKTNKLGFLLRNTRFGRTAIMAARPKENDDETFSPKILTDVSFNYSPKLWLTFTLGANNVFNVYPDRLKDYRNTQEGAQIYPTEATPFGYFGGYYFVMMALQLH